jgi:hypothetical protein
MALFALHFASVAWAVCTLARQLLWTSMVALHRRAYSPTVDHTVPQKRSTTTYNLVSWTLLALAAIATVAAVVGQLAIPLAVASDPDLQQKSTDASFIVSAMLMSVMEIAAAVGFERLSDVARRQVRSRSNSATSRAVTADMIGAVSRLAKSARHLALLMLLLCLFTLIFFLLVGTITGTRSAARRRSRQLSAGTRADARAARPGTG